MNEWMSGNEWMDGWIKMDGETGDRTIRGGLRNDKGNQLSTN